jgi:hypothetical protein
LLVVAVEEVILQLDQVEVEHQAVAMVEIFLQLDHLLELDLLVQQIRAVVAVVMLTL